MNIDTITSVFCSLALVETLGAISVLCSPKAMRLLACWLIANAERFEQGRADRKAAKSARDKAFSERRDDLRHMFGLDEQRRIEEKRA